MGCGQVRNFQQYIENFERRVALLGILSYGLGNMSKIPIRPGKLDDSPISHFLGKQIQTQYLFAIEYYGYLKKSKGFYDYVSQEARFLSDGGCLRITAPVVHFGAIKSKVVADLAPDLMREFHEFKSVLLEKRGFGNGPKHNNSRYKRTSSSSVHSSIDLLRASRQRT
jgi:hypothetical protein